MKPPEFLVNRRNWAALSGLILLCFLNAYLHPHFASDTEAMLSGADVARDCLHRGVFRGCGPGVIHFPLFQYLLGGLWREWGHSIPETLRFLAVLSGLAFAGLFTLSVAAPWRRGKTTEALVMGLFLFVSPLPFYYARSSFNESVAAFLALAYVWSLLRTESFALILLTGFLTGITKEVAPPFVAWLGLLVFFAPRPNPTRRKFMAVILATALGIAANIGFNEFRYSTTVNLANLVPEFQVPSLGQHLAYFLALLFSPNGGVLFFVPLFLPLLVGLVWPAQDERKRARLPWLLVTTAFLIQLVGFSKWYAPFGWVAWGPRLLMAWLPAFAFALIECYPRSINAQAGRLSQNTLLWRGVGGLLLILGLANFASFLSFEAIERWFAPGRHCEKMPVIQADPDYYYACLNGAIWSFRHWFVGYAFESAFKGIRILFSAGYILSFGLLWRRLRREARSA